MIAELLVALISLSSFECVRGNLNPPLSPLEATTVTRVHPGASYKQPYGKAWKVERIRSLFSVDGNGKVGDPVSHVSPVGKIEMHYALKACLGSAAIENGKAAGWRKNEERPFNVYFQPAGDGFSVTYTALDWLWERMLFPSDQTTANDALRELAPGLVP